MTTKRIFIGAAVIGGLVAAGFGGIATADTCAVNTPGAHVCGPAAAGVGPQSDGYGWTSLLDAGHYGTNVLVVGDNGGQAAINQQWYNDSASAYGWRNTTANVAESPVVAGVPVSADAVFTQWVYKYGGSDQRNSDAHVYAQATQLPATPWVAASATQYRYDDGNGTTYCNQNIETHAHAGDVNDDSYHPSSNCLVQVPEVPALPQLPQG